MLQRNRSKTVKKNFEDDEPPLIPVVNKEVHTPVGTENSMFIPSRPDSMASSIGEDFDFPFADQSTAVSMVSLLIDEPRWNRKKTFSGYNFYILRFSIGEQSVAVIITVRMGSSLQNL